MLGTLFGLIVLIFGLVLRFDPEAASRAKSATNERPDDARDAGGQRLRARRWHRVHRPRRVPELSPAPRAPAPAALHLGDLVLVDRGALRLGDVRAVPARYPPHAVVVAAEHDVGWIALVRSRRLHLLLRASRRHGRGARAMAERKVRLAQAHNTIDRRPRRRLLLGAVLQRVPGSQARRLLLRPRDSRAGDLSRGPCTSTRSTTPSPWASR